MCTKHDDENVNRAMAGFNWIQTLEKMQNTQENKKIFKKQDKTCLLKSVLLISCVFWIFFSERWQSTLFQIFNFVVVVRFQVENWAKYRDFTENV